MNPRFVKITDNRSGIINETDLMDQKQVSPLLML